MDILSTSFLIWRIWLQTWLWIIIEKEYKVKSGKTNYSSKSEKVIVSTSWFWQVSYINISKRCIYTCKRTTHPSIYLFVKFQIFFVWSNVSFSPLTPDWWLANCVWVNKEDFVICVLAKSYNLGAVAWSKVIRRQKLSVYAEQPDQTS